ncbi:uncharacterized protein BXZ73DRAFT_78300 [Epithele typhae]|uniref:uncharacterized protein n=1 Tax=Epithele typhae TaxID=378194 RepID=UPI002008E6BD|nr:uncharacterized protein BXZ73DRAFT_78300 [Epithele typhae]KAH9928479.1 hypothetical protein BXZ73DRAFT_78300 [Epithele typhae]
MDYTLKISGSPIHGYGNVDFKVYTQTGPTTQQEDVDMDGGAWMTLPTSSLTLTTLNFDVQYHIMSLLSPADLSRLMRTCSSYFEAGIVLLCSHSKIPLNTVSQVLSFAKFLRVYDPQHTRTPLIRELHFNLEEYTFTLAKGAASPNPDSSGFPSSYFALPAHHPLTEEHLMRDARNRALETFLTLLPQCAALSRLRIDRWYDDAPPSLLHHALTHLTHLTHVRMPLFARGALDLASFARLPRSAPSSSSPRASGRRPRTPSPRSSRSRPRSRRSSCPCAAGARPPRPSRACTARDRVPARGPRPPPRPRPRLPRPPRLALRGARPLHLCGTARARAEDACARERAQAQWRALARDGAVWPWPDLESVAGESACALHALALPRAVRRLSVAFAASEPAAAGDAMLARVLCDARPACLEVRVTNAHFKYNPFPARFGALARMGRAHADARARERGGGDASGGDPVAADDGGGEAAMGIRRFVLSLEGDSVPDYVQVAAILLVRRAARRARPLAVSHVLVRHTVAPFRAAAEHTRRIVHALRAHAAPRAAALALAAPALAWVGVLVELPAAPGAPRWLRAWRVVRPAPRRDRFAFGDARVREGRGGRERGGRAGPGVVLAEVGEGEAWEELAREGMVEAGDGAAW